MKNKIKPITKSLLEGFLYVLGVFAILVLMSGIYMAGYFNGVNDGKSETEAQFSNILSLIGRRVGTSDSIPETPEPLPVTVDERPVKKISSTPVPWGGPELWEEVNIARVGHGVAQLTIREELCTIASLRLNELLEMGKLDGHEGFSNLPERRPDLKWIFEKYAISEFLVQGATTPQEAVQLWENTLGHKKLMTGGEYVYGCIYAQNTFGVAIAAYE